MGVEGETIDPKTSNGSHRITLHICSNLHKPTTLPNLKKWKVHDVDSVLYGIYSCRIKAKGFFLDQVSTVAFRYMAVTSKGILMIYESEDKGYVLNLRQAQTIITETSTRMKNQVPQKVCEMKIKFSFGTITMFLVNDEIARWRIIVGDYHDGQICNSCIVSKRPVDNSKKCKEIQTDESFLANSTVETTEASIQVDEEDKPELDVSIVLKSQSTVCPSSFSRASSTSTFVFSPNTSQSEKFSGANKCPVSSSPISHLAAEIKSKHASPVGPKPPMPNPNNPFGALPGFTVRQRCRATRIFGLTPSFQKKKNQEVSVIEPSVRHGSQSVASIRRVLEEKVSKRLLQMKAQAKNDVNDAGVPKLPATPPPPAPESPLHSSFHVFQTAKRS